MKKGRAPVLRETTTTTSVAKPMNTFNALRKADPIALASTAADVAPPGHIQKAFKFAGQIEPFFTLQKVGGSRFLPGRWHAVARFALSLVFVGFGIACIKRGTFTGMFVSAIYAILYCILSFMSVMKTLRSGKLAMFKESIIVGVLYQTLASVALWMGPISMIFVVNNMGRLPGQRNHLIQYVACMLPAGVFMLDCTLLGAAPYFRQLVVVVPLLVETSIFLVNFTFGVIKRPKDRAMRGFFNLLLLIAVIWAIAAAFLAVAVSRVAACCARTGDVNEDEIEDQEKEQGVGVQVDVENGGNERPANRGDGTNDSSGRHRVASAP